MRRRIAAARRLRDGSIADRDRGIVAERERKRQQRREHRRQQRRERETEGGAND